MGKIENEKTSLPMPIFSTNVWSQRLSRFTLTDDGTRLDLQSERMLFEFPSWPNAAITAAIWNGVRTAISG